MKEITDTILKLEKKYNLLEWRISNVFVWQSARSLVYTTILSLSVPNNSRPQRKSLFKKYMSFCKRFFANLVIMNPFLDFKKYNTLVFESGRKYFTNDEYIDIYIKYLCDELQTENTAYKIINTNHQDLIHVTARLLSMFIYPKLSIKEIDIIRNIELEINESLGVNIDVKTIFTREIKRFKSTYPIYLLLIKFTKAKNIYLINSTDKASLIKAAKDKGIIVSELQHGLIVKEGLIAHFPNTVEDSLEYFPNIFCVWKGLYMNTSKLPLSSKNIICIEHSHLKLMIANNHHISKKTKQILIISQPYHSDAILKFILSNINEMQDYTFIYKLHPAENKDFITDESNCKISKYSNLIIVNNNQSIYSLLAESKFVIGIYSTALFEALHFGCKVILLNLSGVEFACSLIEEGKATLINTDEKLLRAI